MACSPTMVCPQFHHTEYSLNSVYMLPVIVSAFKKTCISLSLVLSRQTLVAALDIVDKDLGACRPSSPHDHPGSSLAILVMLTTTEYSTQ